MAYSEHLPLRLYADFLSCCLTRACVPTIQTVMPVHTEALYMETASCVTTLVYHCYCAETAYTECLLLDKKVELLRATDTAAAATDAATALAAFKPALPETPPLRPFSRRCRPPPASPAPSSTVPGHVCIYGRRVPS